MVFLQRDRAASGLSSSWQAATAVISAVLSHLVVDTPMPFMAAKRITTHEPTCQGANLTDPLLDALAIRQLDLRTRAKHCFNEPCGASHPAGGGKTFSRPR